MNEYYSFSKIYFMAKITFKNEFTNEEIKKWLKSFIKRFFTSQFKRSCMPDGVKVTSVSLSPRGDLRLPSDISYQGYLDEIDSLD
ncbi:nAD+ synthase [Firmicutes bacterium CAG:449]|nr:nAD+ synthase [Firmicutes bacterium CAG:449]